MTSSATGGRPLFEPMVVQFTDALKKTVVVQGWGALMHRSLIAPLEKFSICQKHMSESFNHIHI